MYHFSTISCLEFFTKAFVLSFSSAEIDHIKYCKYNVSITIKFFLLLLVYVVIEGLVLLFVQSTDILNKNAAYNTF